MRHGLVVIAALWIGTHTASLFGADIPAKIEFNRDVRPILSSRCFSCHGPDAGHRKAKLRLDLEEGSRADLGGRQAIAPSKPDESELVARIISTDDTERMPPPRGEALSANEIAVLRKWIEQGAAYQPHWAYLPPKRPAIPTVKDTKWAKNEIDRLLLARWEAESIAPSPGADIVTLTRRLAFDLTGLPPTVEDVAAFAESSDRRAYEKLVDRLLASPHFGERMAMYWFDLVRYANTVGYHGDQEHAINPYRDYVVKAFNENKRFDQFTLEQLAGDLLTDATTEQKIASVYNRLLQTSHEGGVQAKEYLHKYDADRVRNVSAVWLGATVGCAECHDHKFDPYTQRDFYRLAAFFADVDESWMKKGLDATPTNRAPELVVASPLDAKAIDIRTMVTVATTPRDIRVLSRGDWQDETGEIVVPGVPGFLKQIETGDKRATRLDLARWITSPENPQTARVFVNRLWSLFFGAGISTSLEDNGGQGEWPAHPELLDYLATEFVQSGWDIKHMVRLMVTSNAYRQSSLVSGAQHSRDPDNRLFARQARFRLPAEMIRDNALAVSGLLVDRAGGASSHPYQPAGYYAPLNFPKREYKPDTDDNQYRRGVYMHWQRTYLHPMLKAFDAPSREECTARRQTSNTPQSALVLLNDPTFVEAARAFAARMLREGGDDVNSRLSWGVSTALSREATPKERTALKKLLEISRVDFEKDSQSAEKLLQVGLSPRPPNIVSTELAAWSAVAHVILNLNETTMRN